MGELQEEAVASLARKDRPEGDPRPGAIVRLGVDVHEGKVALRELGFSIFPSAFLRLYLCGVLCQTVRYARCGDFLVTHPKR